MHETKNCGRCGSTFECKPGNISQCQCYEIILTLEERMYIEQRFSDCLCAKCLLLLKEEYKLFVERFIFTKMVNKQR